MSLSINYFHQPLLLRAQEISIDIAAALFCGEPIGVTMKRLVMLVKSRYEASRKISVITEEL